MTNPPMSTLGFKIRDHLKEHRQSSHSSALDVSLSSSNERGVETVSDLVKTCLGFFIGVATGYFGYSPSDS